MLARGGLYLEVDTYILKTSQYNHLNEEYCKKKLSQRWNHFQYKGDKIRIQRDLYSSYLIKNVKQDLKTIDNDACVKGFETSLMLPLMDWAQFLAVKFLRKQASLYVSRDVL
jgi:hypothetical protein